MVGGVVGRALKKGTAQVDQLTQVGDMAEQQEADLRARVVDRRR